MDLASILTFTNILICMLGVAAGIVIGALPGLTPTMGVALLLPVTFGMDMLPSFALLLGIYVGGTYGGSIAAILIRTPGTPQASAASSPTSCSSALPVRSQRSPSRSVLPSISR